MALEIQARAAFLRYRFQTVFSGNRQHPKKETRQHAPDERTDHRDRRITPVGAAFPGNRKNRMRDPRSEVACGVDGVSRGAAERQANASHKAPHKVWPKASGRARRGYAR